MLEVSLFGLTAYGVDETVRRDFTGLSIDRGGLTGWWGRPASAGANARGRAGAHGDVDEDLYLGPRFIGLEGKIHEPSSRERFLTAMRLKGLGADGKRGRIVVKEDGLSLWAWCRVVEADVDRVTNAHAPTYELALKCSNPRIFGDVRLDTPPANTPRVLVNRGNFEAAPRFSVWGPHPSGYSILGTGRPSFQVDATLEAGQSDLIDFSTGTVMRNGVPLLGAVPHPRTWTVGAAGSQEWRFVPTGSGGITSEITDTYV